MIWESRQPGTTEDPQSIDRHGPHCHHDKALHFHQGERLTPGEDVVKQGLLGLLLAQIPCHGMPKGDGACVGDGHHHLAPDSFRGRGEGGGDGFSPWGSVGTTDSPIYPICLPTTSNCTKLIILCPSTDLKFYLTMERHGPTPWVLGTGEKQLDLHTLIMIPCDSSFPLKMLIDSGSSTSLINKHLVEKLNIPKIKLSHLKLLVKLTTP